MVNGLHGHNGQNVVKVVPVVQNHEHELAATLYPVMEVRPVLAIPLKQKGALLYHVLYMGGGVTGPIGLIVPQLVAMEQNPDTETVTIHFPNMGENTVLEIPTRVSTVLCNLVQWLENGQSGQTGQTVVKHVMWDGRQGPDHARTHMSGLLKVQVTILALEMKLT